MVVGAKVSDLTAIGFMLYGSTGYTGSLIAQLAVQCDLYPVLAGRNAAKVERQASELGLESRAFDLNHVTAVERAVGEVGIVLHCAGSFGHTAKRSGCRE